MDLDFANIADCVWYLENRVIPCLRVFYPKFDIIHDLETDVAYIDFDELRDYDDAGISRRYYAIEIRIPTANHRGNIPIIEGEMFSTFGAFNQLHIWKSLDQMISCIT